MNYPAKKQPSLFDFIHYECIYMSKSPDFLTQKHGLLGWNLITYEK